MSEPDVLFDLDEVSFRYGSEQILDSVSMKVQRGDFLALLGPNGSGKSTLIRIMLGLQKPDSGLVRVMGRNLPDFTVEVVAEGPEVALQQFLQQIRVGPSGARVEKVDLHWEDHSGEFDRFEVRY